MVVPSDGRALLWPFRALIWAHGWARSGQILALG